MPDASAVTGARRPRVVVLRGHSANPWDLRPWEALRDRYDVSVAVTGSNLFDVDGVELEKRRVRAMRDLLPPGRVGDLAVRLPGERYLGLGSRLEGADIVHSAELGTWFSMQAARLKPKLGFKLALTVWETIPFLGAYRNIRTRPYRERVLEATDLFLPTTERAAAALELEGAPRDRIKVNPPGVDLERFTAPDAPRDEGLILSPGRLVWEKGHQDVMRALAALERGVVEPRRAPPRLLIVGAGPEEARLRRYADELGIGHLVEIRAAVPYDEMPGIHARASAMVLASLPVWWWEEQFGMVLAEALASGTPIVASSSGAIPEVAGEAAAYFTPGDWVGLARILADPPAGREPDRARIERFSTGAAAGRLADAYESLLYSGA